MSFIRQHWFGLVTGIVIFCFLVLFLLVLLAPRQDALRRGFIPCTEAMADKMLSCQEAKTWCMLKAIAANSWCDAKVVGRGFKDWAGGRQPAPWSNYIFIPEMPSDEFFDAAVREEYLRANPAPQSEMPKLKQLQKELENEQNEQQVSASEQPF